MDIVINDDPKGESITTFLRESVTHFQHLFVALQALEYDYILIDTQGAKGINQFSPKIYLPVKKVAPVKGHIITVHG